jgi:hypothetical protein
VKNAFDESYRAYREIRAAVIAHEFEQIYGALLDNGRIVSVRRPKPVPGEYIRAIKQQRGILMNKLVSDAQADQVVVRTGSASNGKDQPERHSLQVKFRLKGTADIGGPLAAKISPQPRTIAEDGSLIVVMEKIGNKWYWEPFGW